MRALGRTRIQSRLTDLLFWTNHYPIVFSRWVVVIIGRAVSCQAECDVFGITILFINENYKYEYEEENIS